MKKIYKYQLGIDGQSIVINSPVKQFLHVESQQGWPMIWAMVDSTLERCKYEVMCMGTGWPLPDELIDESEYLGTALDGAGYVWHYFVRRVDD
jgi:hypothetical protein